MPVQSVTKKGTGPRMRALGAPVILGSGLSKPLGSSFSFTWGAINNGDEIGYIRLAVIDSGTNVVVASIGPLGVLPGASVTLVASWTPPSAQDWGINMILEQRNAPPESVFISTIAVETGDITTTLAGPNLAPVGSPTIS